MKKYILMGEVNGIGGWQLYCDARVIYLTDKGYDVYMLYSTPKKANIKLKGLQEVKKINSVYASQRVYVFTKNQVDIIINDILKHIDYHANDDEVFIESTCIHYALWGELLARRTRGIHFSYLLHSHFENVPVAIKEFFYFKYKQELLGGMTDQTLPDLFGEYVILEQGKTYGMSAAGRDPLSESDECDDLVESIKSKINKETKVIGYFGTLNKPHFMLLCSILTDYFTKHSNTQFCFLSIGTSYSGVPEREQMKIQEKCRNVVSINVPELYPVPKKLFSCMDACIGSWGSANIAARANIMTIRLLDDVFVKPQGVIGITLRKMPYYECAYDEKDLASWLDDILFKNAFASIEYVPPVKPIDYRERHGINDLIIRPFEKRNNSDVYFDTELVDTGSIKEKYLRIFNKTLGYRNTRLLIEIIRAVINKFKKSK